jgi:hypothetical protein
LAAGPRMGMRRKGFIERTASFGFGQKSLHSRSVYL